MLRPRTKTAIRAALCGGILTAASQLTAQAPLLPPAPDLGPPPARQPKLTPLEVQKDPERETDLVPEKQPARMFQARTGMTLERNEQGWLEVVEVREQSDAARAGIKPGDAIREIDGIRVTDRNKLLKFLADNFNRQWFALQVERGPKLLEFVLGDHIQTLGMTIVDDSSNRPFVAILEPQSAAAVGGLEQGDIIEGVNGRKVKDVQSVEDFLIPLLQRASEGQEVQFRVIRGDDTMNVTVVRPATLELPLADAPDIPDVPRPRRVPRDQQDVAAANIGAAPNLPAGQMPPGAGQQPIMPRGISDRQYISSFSNLGGSGLLQGGQTGEFGPLRNIQAVVAVLHFANNSAANTGGVTTGGGAGEAKDFPPIETEVPPGERLQRATPGAVGTGGRRAVGGQQLPANPQQAPANQVLPGSTVPNQGVPAQPQATPGGAGANPQGALQPRSVAPRSLALFQPAQQPAAAAAAQPNAAQPNAAQPNAAAQAAPTGVVPANGVEGISGQQPGAANRLPTRPYDHAFGQNRGDGANGQYPGNGNFGMAGMVIVRAAEQGAVVHARVAGLQPGLYQLAVHQFGDWGDSANQSSGGVAMQLGNIQVDDSGRGWLVAPIGDLNVQALLGRVVVLHSGGTTGTYPSNEIDATGTDSTDGIERLQPGQSPNGATGTIGIPGNRATGAAGAGTTPGIPSNRAAGAAGATPGIPADRAAGAAPNAAGQAPVTPNTVDANNVSPDNGAPTVVDGTTGGNGGVSAGDMPFSQDVIAYGIFGAGNPFRLRAGANFSADPNSANQGTQTDIENPGIQNPGNVDGRTDTTIDQGTENPGAIERLNPGARQRGVPQRGAAQPQRGN